MRDYRYQEIDLFAKDPLKKIVYVSVYNTTGSQWRRRFTRDSAPAALVQRLDPKKIARQYQALSTRIGPPYHWTVDWLADRVGAVRNFDGLNAEWMGKQPSASAALSPKSLAATAYRTALRREPP